MCWTVSRATGCTTTATLSVCTTYIHLNWTTPFSVSHSAPTYVPFRALPVDRWLAAGRADEVDEDANGFVTEDEVLGYLENAMDDIEVKLGQSYI